jgi:adenine-specific DNA-methyltransferase
VVPGASASERDLLGLLGGIATAIAGDRVLTWQGPLQDWALASPTPPDDILDATRTLLGLDDDPLAELYNACISASNRRRLGTVFTPPALVEHMLTLVEHELDDPPSVVIDPGAGVGAFTIAAARTWPEARIVAVDINPVTLGLLATRLAFEADLDEENADAYDHVDLRLASYLDEIESLFSEDTTGPILVLGNPPYTRVQELPPDDRVKAARLAGDLIDSGHANLAMLFQAATLRCMRSTDVSCMVLPGSLSYTRASRALRTTLWNSPRSVTVHRTPATAKAFIGRSVQAAVLLIGAERRRRPKIKLARIQLADSSIELLEKWKLSRTTRQPHNWFLSNAEVQRDGRRKREVVTTIGDIATVRRGVATGANDMFFLTDATVNSLPSDVITAAIPTLRAFDGLELTPAIHMSFGDEDTRRWLLVIPPDAVLDGELAAYIERHKDEVSVRYLPSQRKPWYSINELLRPQILLSPLSKTDFKVVLNSAQAVPSNNLFGISLSDGGDPGPLATWLRSGDGQQELRRLSHRYPGGSHKLEPGRVRAVRLPADLFPR